MNDRRSTSDMLRYLFGDSQVDAQREAVLREAEEAEKTGDTGKLIPKKTTLVSALKSIDIEMGKDTEVNVDELGAWLTIKDTATWHSILRKLGTVEAMNALADEGWVAGIMGDAGADETRDTGDSSSYVINFLCIHEPEMSELDKGLTPEQLGKEFHDGSDVVIPKEQAARDKERANGVKSESDEIDAALVEARELSVPDQHRKKIALSTLKMSDTGAKVMGGMTKAEARDYLKSIGHKVPGDDKPEKDDVTEAADALIEEAKELPDPAERLATDIEHGSGTLHRPQSDFRFILFGISSGNIYGVSSANDLESALQDTIKGAPALYAHSETPEHDNIEAMLQGEGAEIERTENYFALRVPESDEGTFVLVDIRAQDPAVQDQIRILGLIKHANEFVDQQGQEQEPQGQEP